MQKFIKKVFPIIVTIILVLSVCPLQAFAATSGTFEPVEFVTVSVSGATNTGMTDGVITTTAKGSGGVFGIGASAKTATITVYNDSDSDATLSFDWEATSVNQLVIDGSTKTGTSGNFSKLVTAGGSFIVKITTAKNATVNTLELSNFSLTSGSVSYNVTFDYNSSLGSITVNGAAAASGSVQSVEVGNTLTLNATANGSIFLGWIDQSNKRLSTATSYTLAPASDTTVTAVFANTTPWFLVGGEYLYEGLTLAAEKAASAATKTFVLMNNATLSAGDYTIPAGVTLLIPFDSANTLYTDEPATTGAKFVSPTVYRQLTLSSGAHININGAISVSSKITSGQAGSTSVIAGAPSGPHGRIVTEENSSITVNSGANLYTWGYIIGEGSVLAKSGSTVYECFQAQDYRGGNQTTSMKNKVFPMSQYYVQNIEVPLTLEAGASEKTYTNITVSLIGEQGSDVDFIGSSGAMFNLVSGSATKYYDGATDRLYVELSGSAKMSPISMKVQFSNLNSKDYVLPVTNNLTVKINSGGTATIDQDMAVLPGAEIIVDQGATCVISSGANVYAYDADQWGNFCYHDGRLVKFVPLDYAPGRTYMRTEADLVDAKVVVNGIVDATAGYLYTTEGGANVYSTSAGKIKAQPGNATVTYQVLAQDIDSSKNDTYANISVTSARLKNADGSYTETIGSSGDYDYVNGVWKKTCYTHTHVGSVTTQAGCESEGVRTFVCECGDTYTEAIAPTGHTYGEWVLVNKATKDQNGLYQKTCSVCGDTIDDEFAYLEAKDVLVTVTEDGKIIEVFVNEEYADLFTNIKVSFAQNDSAVDVTEFVQNGNSMVFTYNTSNDDAVEIVISAVTANGNAVIADSVFKNIDRIVGNVGEKFVVLDVLEGSDANEDGQTNIKDLIRLKKMTAELEQKTESADLSGDGEVAVNDLTLLAKYLISGKRGMLAHTVTFTDDDGTILETAVVVQGFSAKPEVSPEKEGLVFAGWDKDILHVTQDIVVKALYQ